MQEYKTSYILTKSEILFLISGAHVKRMSPPAAFILNKYLQNSVPSQETVESLVDKKLVRKLVGTVVVEPVVDLLIRSALSAKKLWEIRCPEEDDSALIIFSEDLYLYVRRYKYIEGACKITPFQDKNKLQSEFSGLFISEITRVDCDGNKNNIKSDKDNSWLEED